MLQCNAKLNVTQYTKVIEIGVKLLGLMGWKRRGDCTSKNSTGYHAELESTCKVAGMALLNTAFSRGLNCLSPPPPPPPSPPLIIQGRRVVSGLLTVDSSILLVDSTGLLVVVRIGVLVVGSIRARPVHTAVHSWYDSNLFWLPPQPWYCSLLHDLVRGL